MSRKEMDEPECDFYHAGQQLEDLQCRGCAHCTKIHQNWATFAEELDYGVPLTVREVLEGTPGGETPENPPPSPMPETFNWFPTYSAAKLRTKQLEKTGSLHSPSVD